MANQSPISKDGLNLVYWPNIAVGLKSDSCKPQVIYKPTQVRPGFTGQYSITETVKVGDQCQATFTVDRTLKWRVYDRNTNTGEWTLAEANPAQAAGERLLMSARRGSNDSVLLIEAKGFPRGDIVGQAIGSDGSILNHLPPSVTTFFTQQP
ncbi:hypothetical protein ACIGXA_11390 [Streptomyces fildesensis]|uniref:Uncharacterized protein n=1 Tax=Streptomyces fildesensis TaxID=375757 RepID=A0ABW8C4T8_9ACTN